MQKRWWIVAVAIVVGVYIWGWASEQGYFGGDDTMQYQGQSIKLSRTPNNRLCRCKLEMCLK